MRDLSNTLTRGIERRWRHGAALTAAALIASCSDSTGVRAGAPSQLSFAVTNSSASTASASIVPVTRNGHTLDLTGVSITVERAKLKRQHSDACDDDDRDSEKEGSDEQRPHDSTTNKQCANVKLGPVTVDLPMSGGLVSVPANTIPAGTYREIEVRISAARLKGTFDGQPFDVTIPVSVASEIEFDTPIVVTDGTPVSITVNLPLSDWLTNPDGSFVDPSKILATPSLLAQIKARVAASLRAFEDRDHDNHDDHDGGHGHGD